MVLNNDKYFASKARDIDEFRAQLRLYATECETRVEDLRNSVNELNTSFIQLQRGTGYSNNSDITVAEMRKFELQAVKEKLDHTLASNYEIREQLRKQLKSMLITQQERWKPSNVA
ncbi:uncharacterized protein [Rutidosis leptorrhynchoides]|uniref:uncharacterized protein n=1 Tax=Rutidosis leptorrhynchoides TaxID=125765 RepID=UPI003A997EDC